MSMYHCATTAGSVTNCYISIIGDRCEPSDDKVSVLPLCYHCKMVFMLFTFSVSVVVGFKPSTFGVTRWVFYCATTTDTVNISIFPFTFLVSVGRGIWTLNLEMTGWLFYHCVATADSATDILLVFIFQYWQWQDLTLFPITKCCFYFINVTSLIPSFLPLFFIIQIKLCLPLQCCPLWALIGTMQSTLVTEGWH
jgi:hypothetical protein